MSNPSGPAETRRRFLKLVGGAAVLVPIGGLAGCGGDKAATAPAAPAPAPEPAPAAAPPAADTAAAEPAAAEAPAAELVQLTEDDPVATALGYRHDATQVDAAKYPRHAAGQVCSNCIQFRGAAGDAWGPCGLFPGKLVNAAGWCNGYAPKA